MSPPIEIDGTDITGATIDGQDVEEITVDGDTVFTAAPTLPTWESQFWNQVDNNPTVSFSGDSQTISGKGTGGNMPPAGLVTVDEFELGQDFDAVWDLTVNDTNANTDWAFVPQVNPSNFTWDWAYGGRGDFGSGFLRFYPSQNSRTNLSNSQVSTSTFKIEVRPNGSNVDVTVFLDGSNKGNFSNLPYESSPQKLGWSLQGDAARPIDITVSNLVITVN